MILECRLGKDIFVFGEWEFVSLWGFRQEDKYKSWVRFLRTMNGEPVISKQGALFANCPNLNFDPAALYNKPCLQIEKVINEKSDLFFKLSHFDFEPLLDASLMFHNWQDRLLPFPQIYTPAGDYEKAKRHCDRFINTITNLRVFL